MRTIVASIIVALVLFVGAAGAIAVAGDIGPGENGALPAGLLQAGDIGPGENG